MPGNGSHKSKSLQLIARETALNKRKFSTVLFCFFIIIKWNIAKAIKFR